MKRQFWLLTFIFLFLLSGCQKQEEDIVSLTKEAESAPEEEISETVEEIPEVQRKAITEILDSFRFEHERIKLPAVLEALDKENVQYSGRYIFGTRVDLTLEDGTSLIFLETRDSDMNPSGYELMMKGTEFNKNGFQENYLNCYDVISDEPYYPDLSERLFEEDELWDFDQTRLSIARNQIFAKYGRRFEDPFLNAVFLCKNWYEPKYSAEEFEVKQQDLLTDIEKENLVTVTNYEIKAGYRKSGDYGRAETLLSGSWLDLDGDGQKEQVTYTVKEQENEGIWDEIYKIALSVKSSEGEKITVTKEGCDLHEHCYAVSMDGKHYDLIVADDGASADYQMNFYRYEKGALTDVGTILSSPPDLEVYPDKLAAFEETYHFQCQPVEFEFVFTDGKLVRQEKEYYEYGQNTVTALKEIELYSEKDSRDSVILLSPGDEVSVMGGDLSEWVQLKKASTGETGWLKVKDGTTCFLQDGSEWNSWDLFEGLWFYG